MDKRVHGRQFGVPPREQSRIQAANGKKMAEQWQVNPRGRRNNFESRLSRRTDRAWAAALLTRPSPIGPDRDPSPV
jgi:hypothetical protein